VIPDKRGDLPPPEQEDNRDDERVSSKRMKGQKSPNWSGMDYYSSIFQSEKVVAVHRENERAEREEYGRALRISPCSRSPLLPHHERASERANGRDERAATPAAPATRQGAPPPTKGRTETQKQKRREQRRRKRQEAARQRAEALHRAQGPSESRTRRESRDTQPHRVADPGPASRTRARTQAAAKAATGVPRAAPSASQREEVPIRDVRIPPEGWTLVQRRRRASSRTRSRGRPSYAGAVRNVPNQNQGRSAQPAGNWPTPAPRQQQRGVRDTQKEGRSQQPPPLKRPPRTAAVQVTCPPGQSAVTMRLARERVDFKKLGIDEMRPRRARTGTLVLEIPGTNGAAKADVLAREMQEALRDREGVAITRPVKTAELRIKDIEDSITGLPGTPFPAPPPARTDAYHRDIQRGGVLRRRELVRRGPHGSGQWGSRPRGIG